MFLWRCLTPRVLLAALVPGGSPPSPPPASPRPVPDSAAGRSDQVGDAPARSPDPAPGGPSAPSGAGDHR